MLGAGASKALKLEDVLEACGAAEKSPKPSPAVEVVAAALGSNRLDLDVLAGAIATVVPSLQWRKTGCSLDEVM